MPHESPCGRAAIGSRSTATTTPTSNSCWPRRISAPSAGSSSNTTPWCKPIPCRALAAKRASCASRAAARPATRSASPWRSTATAAGVISIPNWEPCTLSPRPRARSPVPAPRLSPQPTASTSAIRRSPRSWRNSPPPSTASAKPAPRLELPSPAAMFRSTTRPAAKESIPPRSSVSSASSMT